MDPVVFEQSCGFELDEFQRVAIDHLDRDRSVLVAAPTGSGKTVIAEYALARARERGKKFFYTTPMKALSNQKFRDLSRAFPVGEVGLLTGDNSINGAAPLVVMTTEVLRNMIYEESPLVPDLGVAVLDECHYLHDPFRGAVWEEIIILLPASVKMVALSATVSNAAELGDWMNSLRGDVEVVLSGERPVKLRNFYFVGRALTPLFSRDLNRVIGDQLELAKKEQAARRERGRRRSRSDIRPDRVDVVRALAKKEMLPAIYFLFSRAACDDSVSRWREKGERLTSGEEAAQISAYLDEKVAAIDPVDLEVLDYKHLRSALLSGVAAHHAGVLPLFKEAVEELFTSGLIKVVFATETLSLGINMPARTVVIESLSKWGGDKHRPVTPGEYKQLTGRAGRRGIDEVGNAVVLYQSYFSPDHVRSLVRREPSPIVSSFRVTYNMAVNLLAAHDLAESNRLINLSFAQYAVDRKVVTLEAGLEALGERLERELDASRCAEGGDATDYRELEKQASGLKRKLSTLEKDRRNREVKEALSSLKPGDVFIAGGEASQKVLAVVKKQKGGAKDGDILVVDVSGRYRKISARSLAGPPRVIGSVEIERISSPTRKVRRSVAAKMEALGKDARGRKEKRAATAEEEEASRDVSRVRKQLEGHPCNRCMHRQRCLEAARRVEKARREIRSAKRERDTGHDVVSRRLGDVVSVLDEFGFMQGERLTTKGTVLRRVYNECDLLLVEALTRGVLSGLAPEELVALASWFIYESREGETAVERRALDDREHLEGGLGEVLERLEVIEEEMKSAEDKRGLDLLGSLDTGFGEAAYRWAGGAELEEMLSRFPDWSVGDMVRTMKQVIDLLRQISEVTEDPVTERNLDRAMGMVDRGIVGYSSLESILEHEDLLESGEH